MKSKMRITGNRTVIGIICIVLALGITFGIAPLVNRFTDRKVEVVQVKQDVERGHLITEDDVELVKVGALNLSDRTVKNKKYVVGKYAATNLYAGQIMIAFLPYGVKRYILLGSISCAGGVSDGGCGTVGRPTEEHMISPRRDCNRQDEMSVCISFPCMYRMASIPFR